MSRKRFPTADDTEKMKKKRFAVYLNLEGKKTMIFGSGRQTEETARALAACGSAVTVVTEKPTDGLIRMAGDGTVQLLKEPYRREMIPDAFMVFAWSEDPEVNEDLYAACSCLGIPVTVKNHPEKSRFFTEQEAEEETSAGKVPDKEQRTEAAEAADDVQDTRKETDGDLPDSTAVVMYTDGAARGNPDGPGGYGVVISWKDDGGNPVRREYSQGYIRTTNNRMEMMAAIAGLEKLKGHCDVVLHSDSQYLVRAFNDHWIEGWIRKGWVNSQKKPVKNRDLWERLLKAAKPHRIRFVWVKGHNGDPLNERCDELATSAADGDHLIADPRHSPA